MKFLAALLSLSLLASAAGARRYAWDGRVEGVSPLVWACLAEKGRLDAGLWDRLSEDQRREKLRAAAPQAQRREAGLEELFRRAAVARDPKELKALDAKLQASEAWLAKSAKASETARLWLDRVETARRLAGSSADAARFDGPEVSGVRAQRLAAVQDMGSASQGAARFQGSRAVDPLTGRDSDGASIREVRAQTQAPQLWKHVSAKVPLPVPERRAAAIAALQDRIVARDVDVYAHAEARRVLGEQFAQTPPEVLERVLRKGIKILIVPEGAKLTDLPEAKALKTERTFDGRSFADVRGLNDPIQPDGSTIVYVPEEDLTSAKDRPKGDYKPRGVFVHELTHTAVDQGLPEEPSKRLPTKEGLRAAYKQAVYNGAEFQDAYAASSPNEYVAQAADIWFGTYNERPKQEDRDLASLFNWKGPKRDPDWLSRKHPELYKAFYQLYGPPRTLEVP